jgi:hypothetical protein
VNLHETVSETWTIQGQFLYWNFLQ